jgi:hypothetical protein
MHWKPSATGALLRGVARAGTEGEGVVDGGGGGGGGGSGGG